VEARMHSFGKELLVLEISLCQIAGQILQSNYIASTGAASDVHAAMVALFGTILRGLNAACDVFISPSPHAVVVAMCVLLNQAIGAFSDVLDQEPSSSLKGCVLQAIGSVLDKSAKELSAEVYALLVCAHDHLDPNCVAPSLVRQCLEIVSVLENNCASGLLNDKATIAAVIRVCGAMDSLARHHSLSRPQRRQCVITHFTPLQVQDTIIPLQHSHSNIM
jgi:hypothetical protein